MDSSSAIDMSLDELIGYNDPNYGYDAHAGYVLCKNPSKKAQKRQEVKEEIVEQEIEPEQPINKSRLNLRNLIRMRQKNARYNEVTKRRSYDEITYDEDEEQPSEKKRYRRRNNNYKCQANFQQNRSYQNYGRKNFYQKRIQTFNETPNLTVEIPNTRFLGTNNKKPIKTVVTMKITTISD